MSLSILSPKNSASAKPEASATQEPANIHQSAEQIVNLLKVAVFIVVAIALRHAMTDGNSSEEYQPTMPSSTVPTVDPKSELLDLSTVEI